MNQWEVDGETRIRYNGPTAVEVLRTSNGWYYCPQYQKLASSRNLDDMCYAVDKQIEWDLYKQVMSQRKGSST